MHRIVALAFVPNSDPEKKDIVDHLNGNRVDYRVNNLKWSTTEENLRGTPGGKNNPDEIYKLISQKDWFLGKGSNLQKTRKSEILKFKK